MPEYPDVTVYVEALARRILGAEYRGLRIVHPFLLRSVQPQASELERRTVLGVRRIGKQIAIELTGELFIVIHLMIAGRLKWEDAPEGRAEGAAAPPKKIGLAAFSFATGTLILTEAGTKKRASLHLVRGEEALAAFDRGGVEVTEATAEEFRARLLAENHTLKRALTDPRLFSGIGNAYSDEILHRSRLSPLQMTSKLDRDETARLHAASREVLAEWAERLRREAGESFPRNVTAFRSEMAVHGKYNQPCPVCATPVQRIVYAENECDYCPTCQTQGRLLADRSLSRLLKGDWPRTLQELEEIKRPR